MPLEPEASQYLSPRTILPRQPKQHSPVPGEQRQGSIRVMPGPSSSLPHLRGDLPARHPQSLSPVATPLPVEPPGDELQVLVVEVML